MEKIKPVAAHVSIRWNGEALHFSFAAKTWSEVQKIVAATIKKSGTRKI